MIRVFLGALGLLLLPGFVQAQIVVEPEPGETVRVICPTGLSGIVEPDAWQVLCASHPPVPTPVPSTATPMPPTATTTIAPAPSSTVSAPTPTAIQVVAVPCAGTIVGTGGSPTINAGIAAAPDGGTVCIHAGTYAEEVFLLTKRSTLRPFGDGVVVIDGGCTRKHAVTAEYAVAAVSGSTIQGLHLRNTTEVAVLIANPGVNDITVDLNTITDFNCTSYPLEGLAGVAAYYAGSGQRITNNTIIRRAADPTTPGQGNCIWFKSSSASPSGGGHYIAGNTLQGCHDGIGGEIEDDPRGVLDRNTIIENNTVLDCNDDGIQVEGGNLNNIVRNNTIRRCGIGIATAPNLTGPLLIEGNTILEGRPGLYGNVACFKVGNGGTATAIYTNNTCVLNHVLATGWGQTNPGNNPIVASGNRISVGRYVIEFTSGVAAGTTFDGGCLYTSDATRFVKWGGSSILYTTFQAFRDATGQMANGTSSPTCGLD